MENKVEFKVFGRYGLFSDPVTRVGGEKCTYQIPTYQALKGIVESIYWKPSIVWVIDKIRVMKPIRTQTKSAKPRSFHGGKNGNPYDLSIYTYLWDVEYQVQAHFEWNMNREDLINDRNEHKHFLIAKRMIERGGRRDIFLGTRECQGYVEPVRLGEGEGYYDHYGDIAFDLMFHGFDYPNETGKPHLNARFWKPVMVNGVVEFLRPEACSYKRFVKGMPMKKLETVGLEEDVLQEALKEVGE